MRNQGKFEASLLICGGVLLLLHGVRGVVRAIAFFAASSQHMVAAHASGFSIAAAAGEAVGAAVGFVFWPVCSFGVGIGLLWLSHTKRQLCAAT